MIFFLLVVTTLSVLTALYALVMLVGARQAAKDAVVDTMRLDAVTQRHMAISWGGADWTVSAGSTVLGGRDLREVIDAVDNIEADHG